MPWDWPSVTAIDVADLVFVAGGDRAALHELLVDPLLQTGEWTLPHSVAIETALLPGVTDAAAQAVALAAETSGAPVEAVATGTRYELHGDDRRPDPRRQSPGGCWPTR